MTDFKTPTEVRTLLSIYSKAEEDALLLAKAPKASPAFTGTVSGITKSMVGLANVDNTSDANKPVSTAQAAALAPKASPTFTGTVSGVTKTHVGLGNVDNTSDVNKPVSTAQAAAITENLKNVLSVSSQSAGGGAASALPAAPVEYRRITLPDGSRVSIPIYRFIEPLDVIVGGGQSNGKGRGDSALSPAAPEGVEIDGSTIIAPLADPVGGAITGSMWPAFANAWFAATGRMVAIVEVAEGGTSLTPDQAGTNWSPSGTLRSAAASAVNTALTAISESADFQLGDIHFIWVQGENDAQAFNGTTITGPIYTTALIALKDYFKAQVTGFTSMGIVRLGSQNNRTQAAAWAEFRLAQENAAADDAEIKMLYRGTTGFAFDGRQLMGDDLHYGQVGLNEAGTQAAKALAATDDLIVPTAPTVLATAAYVNTDPTVNQTTRTDSHTTAAGTKMLVVVVDAENVTGNNVRTTTATFNGVAMVKAKASFAGTNAGNTTPAGRVDATIFYLTEAEYGGSLSGITANLTVTMNNAVQMLSAVAINLNAVGIQESGFAHVVGGGAGGNPTSTFSAITVVGAPCVAIAINASVSSSATPRTHTLSGATFTEITDSGGTNGAGKSGQRVVAHAALSEGVYTVVSTLSGDADLGSLYVVTFRGKLPTE